MSDIYFNLGFFVCLSNNSYRLRKPIKESKTINVKDHLNCGAWLEIGARTSKVTFQWDTFLRKLCSIFFISANNYIETIKTRLVAGVDLKYGNEGSNL